MPAHRTACDFDSKTVLLAALAGAIVTIWLLVSQTSMTIARQKAEVDLALILAVDCSHSVSRSEFHLQMVGLARAFASEEIIAAIEENIIAVMLVQWSGSDDQIVSVPWRVVSSAASAVALADEISAVPRQSLGKTSISAAIDFAVSQLNASPFIARRQVIDISADGVNNHGEATKFAHQRAIAAGITINGLTILNDVPNLDEYFEKFITGGPGSFVIRADSYEAYAEAIKLKLLREIKGQPVS
ncbi:MAG: DUF1194 domain-containing protein [Hyphomicrobiales bacterium]|nr:DUF1194 domain-containing protein [Hyphomicrobiales bacterium]MCP5000621.1 DUF1194 domain-containing protein [Hyphomicrobiales bacterium]